MAIHVNCPGCKKRYAVNEKFAGKTGPCPNCKHPIKIPEKNLEVTIKDTSLQKSGSASTIAQSTLNPILREEFKLNPIFTALTLCGSLITVVIAILGRQNDLFKNNFFLTSLGLILISPFISLGAYSFLYDDELEPYKGKSLAIRITLCGLFYSFLWGIFVYVSDVTLSGEIWNWFFIGPPFIAAGTLVAVNVLDLDFGAGFSHCAFYLLVTIVLRWCAGMDWIWNISPTNG
jgi:hypothetical protein